MRYLSTVSVLLMSAVACGPSPSEDSDLGAGDPICGDGVVDSGEQCDDGNLADGDGCDADCQSESTANAECGNGVVEADEQCDDGNDEPGDGCHECSMEANECGDGAIGSGEQCDDGNTTPGDGCDADCNTESECGNGRLEPGEQCDDGNTDPGDGCDRECASENGTECGNGQLEMDEQCDDGNTDPGDGCDADCQMEAAELCRPAYALGCGSTDTWSTTFSGSTADVDAYACSPWDESGREYAYTFLAPSSTDVTVSLSGISSDLDVFVIPADAGSCDPDGCATYGDNGATFEATADSTYFVVVDGYQGAEGSYSINLTCGACGDGAVDPGEECDDGNTADGDGCSASCEQEAPVCAPAFDLTCGSTDSWSTDDFGSTDLLDSYGCSSWDESGREYAYRFVSDVTGDVTVSLSDLAADLDLFVVSESGAGCDAMGCVSHGDNTLTFAATSGETYYVIVDGYNGASGSYTVGLECSPALQCTPDISVGCNMYDEWATTAKGSTDVLDSYSCSIYDESGREYAYRFSATTDTQVTVNLTPESGQDLDLFRIDGGSCDAESCDQFGDSTITFDAAAGEVYDIVVDGFLGDEGNYRIDFLCP